MNSVEKKSVDELLKNAFEDEALAYMMYMSYSIQAEDEGYPEIAKIFRTAAKGEKVHALNQLAALGWVPDTERNLEKSIKEETGVCNAFYTEFIKVARAKKRTEAVQSCKWVKKVEESHKDLFKNHLEKLKSDEKIQDQEYFVCTNCGYPETGAPPKSCPVCGAPKSAFEKVE